MNEMIINIRFLRWHLQITEAFRFRIYRNDYHIRTRTWFQVYRFGEHEFV